MIAPLGLELPTSPPFPAHLLNQLTVVKDVGKSQGLPPLSESASLLAAVGADRLKDVHKVP
jgi:hypothetical protein